MDKQTSDIIIAWLFLAFASIGVARYFFGKMSIIAYILIAIFGPIFIILIAFMFGASKQKEK